MFYKFRQNTSGGYFDGYHNVIIETSDAVEANRFAEQSGYVYFGDRDDAWIAVATAGTPSWIARPTTMGTVCSRTAKMQNALHRVCTSSTQVTIL